MATTPRLEDAVGLVEALVETAGAPARDRLLLEAVQTSGLVAGVALWRPVGSRGSSPVWARLLARGDLSRCPGRAAIEALEGGAPPAELPHRGHVLLAGQGAGRVALALSGFQAGDGELDRLEALLGVLVALDPPQQTGWIRRLPSLLPHPGPDPRRLGRALLEQLGRCPRDPAEPAPRGEREPLCASPGADLEPGPPLPPIRRGLDLARTRLAQHGLGVRLVVRGRLQAPTRVPQGALSEVVAELLENIRPLGEGPSGGLRPLRMGLREEPSAWHLRIAPVPDGRAGWPQLAFLPLTLPIGAPRPAEHALVRFLAAGGVLRAEGAGGRPNGWFLRLPKPRPDAVSP